MAKHGFGAQFQLSATAITGSAGLLAEVTSVGLPSASIDLIETTHHFSLNRRREYLPGLTDSNEFTVEMNLVPGSTSDTSCETAAESGTEYFCKATVPAATGTWTYTFKGIVMGYEKGDVSIEDKMTATLTIKPTGAITRAAGA